MTTERSYLDFIKPSAYGDDSLFDVRGCNLCGLCNGRMLVVSPVGNVPCDVLLVGEAPGAEEDDKGVPFIGGSGKVLDAIISEAGLNREDFSIANVVMCRPPKNRKPTKEEIFACSPYLDEVVRRCTPKIIVPLGEHAYKRITGDKKGSITKASGKPVRMVVSGHNCTVLPTVHPAAVMRNPSNRGLLFYAFKMLKNILTPSEGGEYILVDSNESLTEFLNEANTWSKFAFDIETTNLDPWNGDVIGISFCGQEKKAYYVPLLVEGGVFWKDGVLALLKDLLTNEAKKCAHNGKFDIGFLRVAFGWDIKFTFDTMLAANLLYPERKRYNLGDLASSFFPDLIAYKDNVDRGNIAKESLKDVAIYSCKDADATFRLANLFVAELTKDEGLMNEFANICMPVAHALASAWINGMGIDLDYAKGLESEFTIESDRLLKEIRETVGNSKFNPNSSQQKIAYFVDKLRLPVLKKSKKTGKPSCDKDVMLEYAKTHSIANLMIEHGHYGKMLSTYIKPAPNWVASNGRVLTNLHQTRTITGRLSSSDPNMQNIPKRSEIGSRIRGMFVARPGWVLMKVDLSQAELRWLMWFSKDPFLVHVYNDDSLDIHTETGKDLVDFLGLNISVDSPEFAKYRRIAKDVNFGAVYGASPATLAASGGITYNQAQEFLEHRRKRSPGIWKWIDETHAFVKKHGFVRTAYGRKIPLPGVYSDRDYEVAAALRESQNYRIQGSSSQYCCLGMVEIENALRDIGLIKTGFLSTKTADVVGLVNQVHDEVDLELREDVVDVVRPVVERCMTSNKLGIDLKMKVDISVGLRWNEME